MNWKPGDIAIIINPNNYIRKEVRLVGRECELISRLNYECYDWDIRVEGELDNFDISEKCLKRLPPPNEVSSWEDCEWQPKELVRV